MKKNLIKTKDVVKKILLVFLIMLTALMSVSMPTSFISYADDNVGNSLDYTDPLTDLRSDSEFNILAYPFNKNGALELKFFNEYCYSFYTEMQENFALYVYIYNPQALEILDSPLNKIQMAVGYDAKGNPNNYEKFELKLCSFSSEYDYYRLFYKFKVVDHLTNGLSIYNRLNSNERRYDVSGIELVTPNSLNATDKGVSKTYYYTGYAKGYGPNFEAPESTLKCNSKELDTIELKVKHTSYRPEGTNGKNDYTQDSLHSVYFAVPKEKEEKHGTLYGVHATWLNARLKPMLVVGEKAIYDALQQHLGKPWSDNLDFKLYGAYKNGYHSLGPDIGFTYTWWGFSYGENSGEEPHYYGWELPAIYGVFGTESLGWEQDSADNYTVPSNELHEWARSTKETFGGELVLDKYSKSIFESVDDNFTEINVTATDKFDLRNEFITKSWWDKLFVDQNSYISKPIEDKNVIELINPEDIYLDTEPFVNKYLVSKNDVANIKSYVSEYKDTHNVYLLRYMISDYVSQEATIIKKNPFGVWNKEKGTNASFVQETAMLEFDIIDLTFKLEKNFKVIPCISDPIDIFPELTPPVHTNSDRIISKFLAWLVFILLVVVTIFVIKWTIKLFTDFSSRKLAVKILVIIAAVLLALLYVMVLIWGVKQIVNFGGLF